MSQDSDTKQNKTDEEPKPSPVKELFYDIAKELKENLVDAVCNAVKDTAKEKIKKSLKKKKLGEDEGD